MKQKTAKRINSFITRIVSGLGSSAFVFAACYGPGLDTDDREWMRHDDCAACANFRYCKGGGMHLRDSEGRLLLCHVKRLGQG